MSAPVRCPGQYPNDRLDSKCFDCDLRKAPRIDGQPVINGRMQGGYCQDRIPPQPFNLPGWLSKPTTATSP